jgi:hypothetical protein
MTYLDFKILIEQYTGLERDALHIHGAILLYIVAMAVFRQSRRSRFPWLVVLAAELLNEGHDLRINLPGEPAWAIAESLKDLWNTMLWPTVLLLVGRYTMWFQKSHREPEPTAEPVVDTVAVDS